jgi:hypothetical protein
VRCEFADLPEALLRGKFPFRLLGRESGYSVVRSICDAMGSLIDSKPGASFFFPAGFGSHVDHLACRDAAFRLLDHGRLNRIILYEDVPYSWLRFIRIQHYRALSRTIDFESESRKVAFRRDGVSFTEYVSGAKVPFPRGKKLFPLVQASLLSRNLLPRVGGSKRYRGVIRTIALDDAQMAKKKALVFQYASQLPMLFGTEPEHALRALHESFSKEVAIEVTRR